MAYNMATLHSIKKLIKNGDLLGYVGDDRAVFRVDLDAQSLQVGHEGLDAAPNCDELLVVDMQQGVGSVPEA